MSCKIALGDANVNATQLALHIYKRLNRMYDTEHGGFGGAPKFPSPAQTTHFLSRFAASNLRGDLLRGEAEKARDMAVQTMIKIYKGGIRDVVGGGFSRYSVDDHWHVPHCGCLPSPGRCSKDLTIFRAPKSRKCCRPISLCCELLAD